MNTEWIAILLAGATALGAVVLNLLRGAFAAGAVRTLQENMNRRMDEMESKNEALQKSIERLSRDFAAYTGISDGKRLRDEG